jgi:hypothetical protein
VLFAHGEMLSRKLLLIAAVGIASGQTASRPEFEGASLKPNPSGRQGYAIQVLPGGKPGIYDIDLKWSPDSTVAATELSGPSLSTAIQEQLGLKLESGIGPVKVIVVDSAEKPSANE